MRWLVERILEEGDSSQLQGPGGSGMGGSRVVLLPLEGREEWEEMEE